MIIKPKPGYAKVIRITELTIPIPEGLSDEEAVKYVDREANLNLGEKVQVAQYKVWEGWQMKITTRQDTTDE